MDEQTAGATEQAADTAAAGAQEAQTEQPEDLVPSATADEAAPQAEALEEALPSAVVDALEKYLEGELPMASFLIVQTACAEIRKHLQ